MIRLVIVLLFTIIQSAKKCEEAFTVKGPLLRVLSQVSLKFKSVEFKWQTCGESVPTSKYLPIRAGTIIGSRRFEVVPFNRHGWFSKDMLKYKISNYRIIFYIYLTI